MIIFIHLARSKLNFIIPLFLKISHPTSPIYTERIFVFHLWNFPLCFISLQLQTNVWRWPMLKIWLIYLISSQVSPKTRFLIHLQYLPQSCKFHAQFVWTNEWMSSFDRTTRWWKKLPLDMKEWAAHLDNMVHSKRYTVLTSEDWGKLSQASHNCHPKITVEVSTFGITFDVFFLYFHQ